METKNILYTATMVKTHVAQFHIPCLKMLQTMGWHTEVAAKNDYEHPEDCIIPGCDVYHDLPFERRPWNLSNIRALHQLKKLIRHNHYDVIHCHTPVGAMITRMAAAGARRKGTKVVYTAHGFHFYHGAPPVNWLFYYPVEWLLAPLTDVIVTINGEDYAFARKHLRAKKVVYIPGVGVDRSRFYPDAGIRQEKRRELGLREDDFAILTVAEMTKNKNHATILNALGELKDQPEFAHFQYFMVGSGEQWDALQAQTRELGIEDHVHFLGYRRDVADLYRACDLFAFMSFREGLSLALMEAMSSGMPVACARIRGNTDLVEDGVNGVFLGWDYHEISEDILKLYRDPELRRSLGEHAVHSTERLGREQILKDMKQLYEELF